MKKQMGSMNWSSKNGAFLFSPSPNGLSRDPDRKAGSPMTINRARPREELHLSAPVCPSSYMPGTKTGLKEISSGDAQASNVTVGTQAAMVASLVEKTWIEKIHLPATTYRQAFLLGMHRRSLR